MNELRLLQYRTAYINGTPITGDSDHNVTTMDKRLTLVNIAVVRNRSVTFLTGDKNDIWPSEHSYIISLQKLIIAYGCMHAFEVQINEAIIKFYC